MLKETKNLKVLLTNLKDLSNKSYRQFSRSSTKAIYTHTLDKVCQKIENSEKKEKLQNLYYYSNITDNKRRNKNSERSLGGNL